MMIALRLGANSVKNRYREEEGEEEEKKRREKKKEKRQNKTKQNKMKKSSFEILPFCIKRADDSAISIFALNFHEVQLSITVLLEGKCTEPRLFSR